MTFRHTCCTVAKTLAIQIPSRQPSLTPLLLRFKVFLERIDVSFYWDTKSKCKKCSRYVRLFGFNEIVLIGSWKNVNPGLARRFAIENAFEFEDFTEPQLMQILDHKLKDQDLSATDDAKNVARELLSRMKNRPNFGNAGEVENILGLAKARYQKRMMSIPPAQRAQVTFEPQDLDPDYKRGENASANLAKLFEDVVGCDDVIKKLGEYQKIAKAMKAQGLDMRTQIPSNFIFKGPPGKWLKSGLKVRI